MNPTWGRLGEIQVRKGRINNMRPCATPEIALVRVKMSMTPLTGMGVGVSGFFLDAHDENTQQETQAGDRAKTGCFQPEIWCA